MEQQPCISEQLWIGYSNKTLSRAQTDMITDHVGRCEVCADIKEGIDAMDRPETIGSTVASINQKVDLWLQPKRNLSVFWYWSAAAVLVFGVGLSWFYINDESSVATNPKESINVVEQSSEKPEIFNDTGSRPEIPQIKHTPPMASNSEPSFKPEVMFDSKDEGIREDLLEKNSVDDVDGRPRESKGETFKFNSTERKTPADSFNVVIAPDTLARGLTWSFGDNNASAPSYSFSPSATPTATNMEASDFTVKQTGTVTYTQVETIKTKDSKKFSSAKAKSSVDPAPMNNSNISNKSLMNNYSLSKYYNSKDSADLALAQSNYNLNNFAKCLENLKSLTANPGSMYYEDGLFLKAKTLIKQNKAKDAKVVLKTIIAMNGIRKSEADRLLKSLH